LFGYGQYITQRRRALCPRPLACRRLGCDQIRNTVSGSVFGTTVTNFFSDFFFRAGNLFNPPPVQAKVTSKICFPEENGKQVCQ
jgi:hypothetical protein